MPADDPACPVTRPLPGGGGRYLAMDGPGARGRQSERERAISPSAPLFIRGHIPMLGRVQER